MVKSKTTKAKPEAPPVRPKIPVCPKCGSDMVLRRSKFGEFFGCPKYPNCKTVMDLALADAATKKAADILRKSQPPAPAENKEANVAAPVQNSAYKPIRKVSGSPEQEAIWKELLDGKTHVVVEAVAGSGKTFTMIQACFRLPRTMNIAFVAFNKHIATEAGGKLKASGCTNVACSTYHSFGLRCIKASYPNTQISEYKTDDILESYPIPPLMQPYEWRQIKSLISKLTGFAKNYLLDDSQSDFFNKLEEIADHHGIDLNGIGQKALGYVPRVLADSKLRAPSTIDFDDMIWLPVVLKLHPTTTYDMLIVDEAQDTNLCQQHLALQLCPTGRIVIVGDRFQSIYGFRGADVTAIPSLTERLGNTSRGVKSLPLTVTRRCPKCHVDLAQAIVPQIRALDDAPIGAIQVVSEPAALDLMQPGDLVLCRVNAALIPAAYGLLRRGVKAVIRGRDIAQGLLSLITKLEQQSTDLPSLVTRLREYRYEELQRLAPLGDKAAGRVGALMDKCDCLEELISGVRSVAELRGRIESLFADFEPDGRPREAVILGTVHRTKGLEGERVFVLKPELLPHPMAKREWEQVQEANLAYVAVTRAKFDVQKNAPGTLFFCGLVPCVYQKPAQEQIPLPEAE